MTGEQFNFRLDGQYSKKLKKAALDKEIKSSTLAANIVKKSLDFWEKKSERGEITQARFVLSKFMEMLDTSKIDDSLEDIVSYILGEMKIQVGKLDFDEFEQRITKWNKENNLEFAKFEESGSITIYQNMILVKIGQRFNAKFMQRCLRKWARL